MSKHGTLITISDDQEGNNLRIVTDSTPFPVTAVSESLSSKIGDTITESRITADLLREILGQIKITNAHLSAITGENFTEVDTL